MKSNIVKHLLEADSRDPGCEASFELLDQYVDALLRAEKVEVLFPSVVAHLRHCAACREDTEGLLEALREKNPPQG
jgi:hypothetical protein